MVERNELQTVYTANTRGFERGTSRVERRLARLDGTMASRLDRIDRRWARSSRAVDGVRRSISTLVLAGGLAAFGRQAITVAKNFEAAMNRVRAASGASNAQLAALRREARRLGSETSFSASEAAAAIETLVRNGVKVPAILGGALEASLALAAATGGDLARAADLATDVMAQFGFTAADLGTVVDTVTGAMINSKFGFDDFALAIGQGGAVAAQSGVEFDDFATAIAATAQAFTSGSDAGTSFKTFVTRLVGDGAKAKAAIAELGLEFFDAAGNLKPMREIAEELRQGLAGLSEQARIASLKKIFGTDAIRTAAALAKQGAAGFDRLAVAIGKVSAADQAEARLAGLEGATRRVAAAWEGLLLSIGDGGGLSATTVAAEALAGALNLLADNLDVVLAASLAVAGSRGVGALITSLNLQRAAVAAVVAERTREAALAQSAAAAARTEVAARTLNLRTLALETKSKAQLANANRALVAANVQAAAATQAHATAVGALAVAQGRLSLAAGLAGRAMGALRGVMGFFGGPVGLAITAISVGILAISANAGEASTSVEALAQRFQTLTGQIEKIRKLDRDLATDTAKLTTANEALETAIRAQGDAAGDVMRIEINAINKRIAAHKKYRQDLAFSARAQLAFAQRDLANARDNFARIAAPTGAEQVAGTREFLAANPEVKDRVDAEARREGLSRAARGALLRRQPEFQAFQAGDVPRRFAAIDAKLNAAELLSERELTLVEGRKGLSGAVVNEGLIRDALDALENPAAVVKTPDPVTTGTRTGKGTPAEAGGLLGGSAERLQAIERERQAFGKLGAELAALEERQRLLDEARRAGVELTPEVITQIDARAAVFGVMRAQVDDLREAEELLQRSQEENLTTEEKRVRFAERLEELRPALIELAGSEAAAQEVINAEMERFNRLLNDTEDIGKSVGDALVSAFEDVATNFDSAGDAAKRLLITLVKIALEAHAAPFLKSIFNSLGSSIGLGGGKAGGSALKIGFGGGGFTGDGGVLEPAGIVHRGEFVVRAPFARRALPLLEAINDGRLGGFAGGGLVGAPRIEAPRLPVIEPAVSVAISSVTELHVHGQGAGDPAALLEAVRPELDRRDRRLKDETVRAVAIRNRRDPRYLD